MSVNGGSVSWCPGCGQEVARGWHGPGVCGAPLANAPTPPAPINYDFLRQIIREEIQRQLPREEGKP